MTVSTGNGSVGHQLLSEGSHYRLTILVYVIFVAYYALKGWAPPIPLEPTGDEDKSRMMRMPIFGYLKLYRTKNCDLLIGWYPILQELFGDKIRI